MPQGSDGRGVVRRSGPRPVGNRGGAPVRPSPVKPPAGRPPRPADPAPPRAAAPVLVAVAALLALAGCGAEDGATGSPATASAPSPAPTTVATGEGALTPTSGPTMGGMTTSPPPPGDEPGTTSPSPSPRPSGGSLPLLPRPTAPPTEPTDVPRPTVLVGEVVEPSAPGCVEMTSGGQVFSLQLPADVQVAVGDRVRVAGTPRPVERGTACAGTQVVVTDVAPA